MTRLAVAFLSFALLPPRAADDRPNVVLCMTDDQGWGDVSYNGLKAVRTPNLDALASSGLRFNRFYAQAPVCSPTRGSVLTGRHPNRYGCFLFGYPLRAEEATLAQALQAAGYATGHFGKWHLNGVSGPGKPISADDPLHPGRFGFDEWLSVSNFFDLDPAMSRNGTTVQLKGDGSDLIVDEALRFIARAKESKKPFLAVVWFGNPHAPHKALPEDEKQAGSAYYGEILAIDRAMGRLRADLRKLDVAENTLLWFTSDNGATGPGSTGGLRGKKGTVWEGGVRVPGMIEWPARIRKPFATDVPAVSSDIFPTVLEVAGAKPARKIEPVDGVSLVPLIEGKMADRPRPIGFWHYAPGKKGAAEFAKEAGQAAWAENRFKLVRPGPTRYELYDLAADPAEERDVAAGNPDVVERMKRDLDAWQESVLRSFRGEDYR
jgi:arylsulfatase A-like enzyme